MAEDHEELLDLFMDIHDETYVPVKADRTEIIRAPFSIPGSKFTSLKHILPELPYRKKFIDHFCGSGVVTFNRSPSELDVMNDRYGGIVAFYNCLKNSKKKDELIQWLELSKHSRELFQDCRRTWCTETDDVTRAAKWFYMVRASVIGKGDCFARSTNSRPPIVIPNALKLFQPIHDRLTWVTLENLDFEVCAYDYDSEDAVHYFDPPYLGTDVTVYNGVPVWKLEDLQRLLLTIKHMKGFCALSHYQNEIIDAQDYWTKVIKWDVPIRAEVQAFDEANGKAHYRNVQQVDHVTEVLYIKEAA